MRELFERVLDLQLQHSSQNSPEMAARGDLVRNAIPSEMRGWAAAQSPAVLPFKGRLNVQGRDGTGLKTFVPWVRIHSPDLSPSAQSGWYVVYLFRQDGEGVALCISHGSTRFDGGDFKPRTAAEAASLMVWGRGLVGADAAAMGFQVGVDLGSSEKLSRAYERTTAFSKTYRRDAIPPDDVLATDAELAVNLLGELYRAQELGTAPDAEPPEVREAEAALAQVSRPGSKPTAAGQGFGLSAAERVAVETRAMDAAVGWLISAGFTAIKDVHATQSYDFVATRDGVEHAVEVKGTTSGLGKVILTAKEVELHKTHAANLLIVVHGISLHKHKIEATGGAVHALDPFDIESCELVPLSFMCWLPAA